MREISKMDHDMSSDIMTVPEPSISSYTDGQRSLYAPQTTTGTTTATDDNDNDEIFSDIDYWFGSIYFKCLLAQDIFERASTGCDFVTVDVC